jgi:hypothetical protein
MAEFPPKLQESFYKWFTQLSMGVAVGFIIVAALYPNRLASRITELEIQNERITANSKYLEGQLTGIKSSTERTRKLHNEYISNLVTELNAVYDKIDHLKARLPPEVEQPPQLGAND